MKKYSIILLALVALAGCEKDNETHYTVRRLSSFEESAPDGSQKRVETYTYNSEGYDIRSTLDGTLTGTVSYRYGADSLVRTDSTVTDGVLKLESTTVTRYLNEYRNDISSVETVYADGSPVRLESYSYDNGTCTITVTEGGVPVSQQVISNLYNGTSASDYDYDPAEDEWVFAGREDFIYSDYLRNTLVSHNTYDSEDVLKESEVYSYDRETTTAITYVGDVATLKNVFVNSGLRIVFERFKAVEGVWTETTKGFYQYEYVTM